MSDLALSEDQEAARAAVMAALATGQQVVTMVGPAGSGKTTMMFAVLEGVEALGRETVLVCPTGKAASVLRDKTEMHATTIHKALYGGVDEDGAELVFSSPHPPCGAGGLVVCDEASMVGKPLHDDLVGQLPKDAQLLYVGDREQLPPVNQPWGPNFDAPDAALTEVHRQAQDSPILSLATAIRTGQAWSGWGEDCVRERGDPVAWLVERAEQDATLLAYTNKTRQAMNHGVRAALGRDGALVVGDRVVCLLNSDGLGIMNGEVDTVVEVRQNKRSSKRYKARVVSVEFASGIKARVNLDLLGGKVSDFKMWARRVDNDDDLIHIDYGYCLTVHKSQGSEWDEVGFIADGGFQWLKSKDPSEARRLAYTAVTRASKRLRIFS